MLLKIIRNGLGYLVILISQFIPIKKQARSSEEQNCVNNATRSLTFYQFYACPFCLKTRRAFKRLGLHIRTLDATKDPARSELLAGGGQIKVPCLRIENKGVVVWMYESNEIIEYLDRHFGEASEPCSELNY